MSILTLDGITAKTVTSARITTRVLFSGAEAGVPVMFVHGNVTSATWWEEVMLTLPDGFRGIALDQRGYGDADPTKKVDATRGMGDLADDLRALLDTLGIQQAHFVSNSLGGNVIWRALMDFPERFFSAVQVAPGSPYGFACTKDAQGTPCYDDFAGSGAGLINKEFLRLMGEGDRSTSSLFSPRNYFTRLWPETYKAPREEELLSSMLSTHLGEQDYPGDTVPSTNWPLFAPGVWGVNNALSPKYIDNPARLYDIAPKLPIVWVRGALDGIVADKSLADFGTLGAMGLIPDYPGADVYPSQPMISQTRAILEGYARAGGQYREVVMEGTMHTPFIDRLDEFNAILHPHLMG